MSREPDAGMQREPGTAAQAPHAQATEDAVNGTGPRLPDGGSGCDSAGLASEPSASMLALPSRPGTQARMLVTACADGHGGVFEGVPAGEDPGWVLGGGDVVLDIAWAGGPGSHRGTDVAVRQVICGDLALVAGWEGLGPGWPERVRPAVAAVMRLYCAVELAGGEIYLQPPEQWPAEPVMVPAAGPQPQLTAESPGVWPGMLAPLLEAGVLQPGETLTWWRRNKGTSYTVTILPGGALQTADGRCTPLSARPPPTPAGSTAATGGWPGGAPMAYPSTTSASRCWPATPTCTTPGPRQPGTGHARPAPDRSPWKQPNKP